MTTTQASLIRRIRAVVTCCAVAVAGCGSQSTSPDSVASTNAPAASNDEIDHDKGTEATTHDAVAETPTVRNSVQVVLNGLRSRMGKVGCALFTSERGFPQDVRAARQALWCPIEGTQAICAFDDVPVGPCAIGCFHDENDDGVVATGLYGMPLEGIAASNDALCIMGPPRYQDARWEYTGEPAVLQLKVTYNVKQK